MSGRSRRQDRPNSRGSRSRFSGFSEYLGLVPEEIREKIADAILKADTETVEGLRELTRMLLAEVVRGTISPHVADTIVNYLQMELKTHAHTAPTLRDVDPTTAVTVNFLNQAFEARQEIEVAAAKQLPLAQPPEGILEDLEAQKIKEPLLIDVGGSSGK